MALFSFDERQLISYVMSGPHVTFAARSSSETYRILEELGLSVTAWQGDDESYRLSLHQSYTTHGLVIREAPPKGCDAPPDAWKMDRLIWQKNWATDHHLPEFEFQGASPSRGEVMKALDLARQQWASPHVSRSVVRVPYFTPSTFHQLYEVLAPQRGAPPGRRGGLRRASTGQGSGSEGRSPMTLQAWQPGDERSDGEDEETLEKSLLAERLKRQGFEHAVFGDGSGIRDRPATASPTPIDNQAPPPLPRAAQSARPPTAPAAPPQHGACSLRASAHDGTSSGEALPPPWRGTSRKDATTWGTSTARSTAWRPSWRPSSDERQRLLSESMARLSAACPRTPTRPRTPRAQARYTLAPPAPRLVDGMLYGGRHGGRAGAIDSTDDHVDALARKRCEQAVRRAILAG